MQRNNRVTNVDGGEENSEHNITGEVRIELSPGDTPTHCDFKDAKLFRQLCPLLSCMRIFGLFFQRSVDNDGKQKSDCIRFYCYFICGLMIANVLRSFSVYRVSDTFDHNMNQKLLFTIWSAECTVKVIVVLVACHRQDELPAFFRMWKRASNDATLDRLFLLAMKKCIFFSWMFIIGNAIVFTLLIVYVPVLQDIFMEVMWRDANSSNYKYVFKVLLSFLAALNSSTSMFPLSLFVLLSLATGIQMRRFSKKLQTAITEDDFHGKIEEFRLEHQNLSEIVALLDKIFSPMIAAAFSANIPMFCLVLYTLVTSIEIHVSLVFINIFWLLFILLQISIVSVASAAVCAAAHSPLDYIYKIRFSNTSNDVQLQMQLFLSKLTGTQIGLSALKLFVVDRPTILTIAGMMVTYFVLLIQFKIPITGVDCGCNVTGTVHLLNQTLEIVSS